MKFKIINLAIYVENIERKIHILYINLYKLLQIKLQNRRIPMSSDKIQILDSINLSPLNTSKSKAMYSFGKSTRFSDHKQANSSFYDKPSVLNSRGTSFGFGNKSDIINKYHYSPSPDRYEKKSDFEVSPKKGISIGIGREDCKNISIFNMSKYPAPTDYTVKDKENSPGYSMRPKVKLPSMFPEIRTPGPGHYVSEHIDKQGNTFNSKYKSNICFKIHEKSPTKVSKHEAPVLGPETYNTIMSATGKQLLAKNKTEKSFYFDKKPRETFYVESTSPGPGTYQIFSEFNR